jgi:predicted phage tail component-like protein
MPDMIGGFSFNGIHCREFNLVGKSIKRPMLPPAKVRRVEIPGSSGSYDFDDLEYELRPITTQLAYIGDDYYELRSRARRIAAWLSQPIWRKLIMDDERDKYYLAKVTGELDLETLWQLGRVDVAFDCQPFAYSIEDVVFEGLGTVVHPGTRRIDFHAPQGSKFTIEADTAKQSSFTVGTRILEYDGTAGHLVIDSVNMEVTLNNSNVFNKISGDIDRFFTLNPGENEIGATGVSNVVTTFTPLWL